MNFQFGDLALESCSAHRLGVHGVQCPLRAGILINEDALCNNDFLTPQYALVYIIHGEGSYEDEQHGKIPVTAGCFVQRFPGRLHHLNIHNHSVTAYLAVPAEVLEMLKLTASLASEAPVFEAGIQASIVYGYLEMIDELKAKSEEDMMSVLIRAQKYLQRFHQLASSAKNPAHAAILEAISRLSENFQSKLSLPELAASLGMSYGNFRKLFTEHCGQSPGDFRIHGRIERAQEYLLEGRRINECALMLSYPDAYSFSRQFKKVCGCSPTKFLEQQG